MLPRRESEQFHPRAFFSLAKNYRKKVTSFSPLPTPCIHSFKTDTAITRTPNAVRHSDFEQGMGMEVMLKKICSLKRHSSIFFLCVCVCAGGTIRPPPPTRKFC